ncbi:unnamed protein product [Lota lota]
MTAAPEDFLSPDELRKKLYQTFKSKGVLDTLKTQLRNQLIQELKHPLFSGGETVPGSASSRADSLLVTASHTIVADYLKTSGYEYTLSVFYPESGLRKDKILSTKDLLQFMKLSPHSPLYNSLVGITEHCGFPPGFLTSLLTHLADPCGHKYCSDADTQTTSEGSYRGSLVDKMKMIDQEYESLPHRGDKWMSYESKLAAYKRELETQMHAEMNVKMQHFKDVELARVKMDEQARAQKEFAKFRRDLEKAYEMKTNALMNREKNAIDRLQKQQEIDENNVYMQRQTLLKEIEKVRNRENDLKLRMEGFEKMCESHTDKVKAMEDLLRRRELAVKTSEDTYEQKLHNELSRYKLELKEEFIQRTEQLAENENRNKGMCLYSLSQKKEYECRTNTREGLCSVALEASRQQASLLGQQKELLSERLEAVSDYSGLKREKVELQGELRLLRRRLEEAQEESKLLRADAGRPSEAHLALQKELQQLQGARRQEQEEFDKQRQVLQTQLQGEVERCAHLKAQLMESEEKSHWLNTHAEEMKMQLRQTQQALENEVLRNPKPSLVDRSVLELSADMLVPPDLYVQRARPSGLFLGHYDDAGGGGVCEAGGTLRGRTLPRWAPGVSPEPEETDLLSGAKARIRELEREAETLEEAYRSYQQRAVRAPVSHLLLAPRPYSPPPPARRRPPAHRSRPPSPRRSQVSGAPFSPPPQHQHVSRPAGTPSPDPDAMPPRPGTASADRTQRRPSGPAGDSDLRSFADPSSATRSPPRSPSRRLSSTPRSPSRRLSSTPRSPSRRLSSTPRSPSRRLSSTPRSPSRRLSSTPRSPSRRLSSTPRSPSRRLSSTPLSASGQRSRPERPEGICTSVGPVLSSPLPLKCVCYRAHTLCFMKGNEAPGESAEEESEERRRERERKERRERQQRDDAKQRELEELSRLEREMVTLEVKNAESSDGEDEREEKEEALGGKKSEGEQQEEEEEEEGSGVTRSPREDPLQKYMKMVLQARGARRAQSPARAEPEAASPDARSSSGERDDSIAVDSHEAVDDDFW